MGRRYVDWMIGATIMAALMVMACAVAPTSGETTSYKAPRSPHGDGTPDLNGIWQVMNTANWDLLDHMPQPPPVVAMGAWAVQPPGRSVVEGNEIPYKPEASTKRKENFAKRLTLDPELKCYLPGVPRAMYMPYPFQIVQTPAWILMAFEFASANRAVHIGSLPEPEVDTWMGQSTGRWEGDTLVIDTIGLNDRTWFDRAGNFHSDALHVVERLTPTGPGILAYEATIEDPNVFTRPWKITMPLYRHVEPHAQLLEFQCIPLVEETLYGHLAKKPGN
jgi:hypothetical protein